MPLKIEKDSKLKSSINLIIVQLGLYGIPLIATPYIVRTVGIENYGKYIFFQAVIGLLTVIVNYGFVQSGVRDISASKSLSSINYEYSQIMYSKLFMMLIAFFIGMLLFFFNKFNREKILYAYSFLSLVVAFLDISFVYQGIEKLKDYMNMNLLGNVFVLILLFLVVKRKDDYIFLPIVFSLPRIIAFLFSIFLLYYRFTIKPIYFSFRGIFGKLKSNFNFFVTNIFIILYTRTTTIILGLLTSNEYVGYYGIADQLVYAYSNIQGKISAVYHPQIVKNFQNNFKEGISKTKESIFVISIIAIAGFMFTQFFAYDLLCILFKENAKFSQVPFRILSLNLISIHLSSILGMQVLLSFYKDKDLLRPSIYAAVLNLSIGSILIFYFKHIGAAISVAVIEILVFLYFYRKTRSYGIKVFDGKLIKRLFKYAFFLVIGLIFLKWLYLSLYLKVLIKFPVIVILYGFCILFTARFFNMVDLKNRKILVE